MSAFVRHFLLHRQRSRSHLVRGAGAQNACVIALLTSPLLTRPSLILASISPVERSSGEIRSPALRWRSMSTSASVESGKAQTIGQAWEEYFADPSRWWDNRVHKMYPRSSDFKHKVTKKALWVDGGSNPLWVKTMLKLAPQSKLPSSSDSQEIVLPIRSIKGSIGRRGFLPTSARESRQTVEVGGGSTHIHRAKSARESSNVLKNRLQQGIAVRAYMIVEVLKRCLKPEDLTAVKQIHECIIKSGMQQNVLVANNLISAYIKCGRFEGASGVFEILLKKNVHTWTKMIGGYAQRGRAKDAMDLFNQMRQEGVEPDSVTYLSILKACVSPSALEWGKEVHAQIRRGGSESDLRVGTAVLKMYAMCGSIKEARNTFDNLASRDVISWNVMIGAYAEGGDGEEAYRLLGQMKEEGLSPDAITFMSILNACASSGALEWVKGVHRHAREGGCASDVRVGNALIHMYAKCASIDDARQVFDMMDGRDLITWNSIVGAYAECGRGEEAHRLFLQLIQEGFKPNAVTYMSILNSCSSTRDLDRVKEVHNHVRGAGFDSDVRVGNALVHMYSKCGSIDDARLVFDGMKQRDARTWTAMIGGLAQGGRESEAYELLLRMKRKGLQPDEFTYTSILNASASTGALDWVKKIHKHAREAGFESDVRVGNALAHMYAKCGSTLDARVVFERMEQRDVRTWTVMIGAYAESGCGNEAYLLFSRMIREGFKPDAVTYMSILNACASAGALEWVREVHSHACVGGFESDVRVGNALILMYAKCGSMEDARQVFDRMEQRDVGTWRVMIGGLAQNGCESEAYELLLRTKRKGLQPDAYMYASILNACISPGALDWVKEIHSDAREAGLESDVLVSKALVHVYAKCGSVDDASLIFDRMTDRDLITWSLLIGAYAESGRGEEAYRLFLRLIQDGFKPNAVTYLSILNACASTGALEWVKEVHNHARVGGFESDVRVGNALIHMFAKCGSIDDATQIFDRMEHRDVRTWTAMIGGLAQHGCERAAYELLVRMKREGLQPDAFTYASILNACASTGALEWVRKVHIDAREGGFESDMHVAKALVHMYAKCGGLNDARLLFDRMEERDLITWAVMIGAYAEGGSGEEAYQLFRQMIVEGFKPNAITYLSILNALSSAGALEWVKEVHSHARGGGFESDVRVGNALVHMYAKCGSIDDARLAFDSMEERDVRTWTTLIGGLAQHGCGSEALEIFRKMNDAGVKPDGYSFVAVLSACSHAGLVDEGRQLFATMSKDYGVVPDVLHCNCMVDILGRAGHLEEAKLFIDKMSVEPNGATWGALLGACRSFGNLKLGELAAKEFVKLEPENASAYVLLSNIYAASGKLEEASLVRSMMQERGIIKEPGRSWIEVDNKIHTFVVGDKSHKDTKEIYAELSRWTDKIKAEGYLPNTRVVLHDMDERDKEFSLCSHSEKLAIAYGLMCIPGRKPIYVYKNLRVCVDCHIATKLISKVTKKVIVVRDASRFHHFKDGLCSCKDYW